MRLALVVKQHLHALQMTPLDSPVQGRLPKLVYGGD